MCPFRGGCPRSTRLGTVGTMNQCDLQVQLYLLAHDPATCLQGLLPVEKPVQPADDSGSGERRLLVAGLIRLLLLDPDVEADRSRGVADRQVSDQSVAFIASHLHTGALEEHLRVVLDREEVLRAQVIVAVQAAGVDTRRLYRALGAGVRRIAPIQLHPAAEIAEMAVDGEELHECARESQAGVARVDLVADARPCRDGGGRRPPGGCRLGYLLELSRPGGGPAHRLAEPAGGRFDLAEAGGAQLTGRGAEDLEHAQHVAAIVDRERTDGLEAGA